MQRSVHTERIHLRYDEDSVTRYCTESKNCSSFKVRYYFSSMLVLTHLLAQRNSDIQDHSITVFSKFAAQTCFESDLFQVSPQPSTWPQICIFLCNLLGQEVLTFPMNLVSSAKNSLISPGSHVVLNSSCLYQV